MWHLCYVEVKKVDKTQITAFPVLLIIPSRWWMTSIIHLRHLWNKMPIKKSMFLKCWVDIRCYQTDIRLHIMSISIQFNIYIIKYFWIYKIIYCLVKILTYLISNRVCAVLMIKSIWNLTANLYLSCFAFDNKR